MKVEEMEAGPELDALVARTIGCNVQRAKDGRAWCGCERILPLGWRPHDDPTHPLRGLYAYSTDTAAILPVAEETVGAVGIIEIELHPPEDGSGLCYAQVSLWVDDGPNHAEAEAGTGAEAISLALARAVVKTKGVEEVEG